MASHTVLGAKNLRKWKPTQKFQPHRVLGLQTGCGAADAAEGTPSSVNAPPTSLRATKPGALNFASGPVGPLLGFREHRQPAGEES